MPQDIKKLSILELNELAKEIRQMLLQTVCETGGHIAPNLGVVELTLALHSVYDTSKDRLIWDVGHQSYVHKILTGRKDMFSSLRQYEGLAGFPKREESIHDAFNTGHSSTSISAALGYALARKRLCEDYNVIAVIGDGALTGGESFEAMNQAGQLGADFLVVLNDNEMSISKNVGAMSSYLSRLRSDPFYTNRKKDIEFLLRKIPTIGSTVVKAVERVKDSLKYLLVPGILFEELGFTYLGPINGHNIEDLKLVLNKCKNLSGPVLLHVITEKGKGYEPARLNPTAFHGVGKFDIATGKINKIPGAPTYTNVFSDTLVELAGYNEKIVAITAAMPEGTGMSKFAQKYPERFFDVGIGEQNAVTMAAAMALKGLRPILAIYSTFLQRAYDQIVHDVCLQNAPVLFAIDRAGLVGEDGPTHHGVFDFSYLRHIPGMSVLAPKDEMELKNMIFTALTYDGPVAIRYPRGKAIGIPFEGDYHSITWGQGEVLKEGTDILIIAVGSMVYPALSVREILISYGLECTVINARFIKPLDEQLITKNVLSHKYLVTMEENVVAGGFGSGVLELLMQKGVAINNALLLGLPDEFITHGKPEILKKNIELTPDTMADKIIKHFSLKKKKSQKVRISMFSK